MKPCRDRTECVVSQGPHSKSVVGFVLDVSRMVHVNRASSLLLCVLVGK